MAHRSSLQSVHRHFANLHIRPVDDIFERENGIIEQVITGKADSSNSVLRLPLLRYLSALVFLFGLLLNGRNICRNLQKSIPQQTELYARWTNGTGLEDYHACMEMGETSGKSHGICKVYEKDVEAGLNGLLVVAEFAMIGGAIIMGIFNLYFLSRTTTTADVTESSGNWGHVAKGFEWFEYASTTSALKMLPLAKELPKKLRAGYKLRNAKLKANDGVLDLSERMYSILRLLVSVICCILILSAGIFALYLKMESDSLEKLTHTPIAQWKRGQWLTFLGFANQISGLVPIGFVKKKAVLFLFFTGEDAELGIEEENAMHEFEAILHKEMFFHFGVVGGFVASLTLSSDDLQKIVLTEGPTDGASNNAPRQDAPLGKKRQ